MKRLPVTESSLLGYMEYKNHIRGKFSGASEEDILEDIVSAGQLRYRDLTEFIKIQTVEGVIAALTKTPYHPALVWL